MKYIERKLIWTPSDPDRFIIIDNSLYGSDWEVFTDGTFSIQRTSIENKIKFILKRWEIILWEYDFVWNIIKLKAWDDIFYAKIWEKSMFIRLKTGKNIAWEFDKIWKIREGMGNNEYFLAKNWWNEMYVSFLSRLPVWWEFDKVWNVFDVEVMKVFFAQKNDKMFYINIDNGANIWWEFDYAGTVKQEAWVSFFRAIRWWKMMYIDFKTGLPIWGEYDKVSQTIHKNKEWKRYFEAMLGDKKLFISIISWEQLNTLWNAIKQTLSMNVMDILNKKII